MKRTSLIILLLAASMGMFSCISCNRNNRVGNDRDCHGCIGSAGYSWSELLQKCIRPFEDGVRLSPVEKGSVSYAAYLVFNGDSSMVEVFMPQLEKNPILKKDVIGLDEMVWNSTDSGSPVVKKTGNRYEILVDGKTVFRN